MRDDQDGDDVSSDRRMRGRRSSHKKRLMRVSTRAHESTKEPTKLDQRYEGNIGMWVQKLHSENKKVKHSENEKSGDLAPPCREYETHKDVDENDRILETLHKFKGWMRRIWRWGQCYTQYCYPSLRSIEYYKKARENHKKRKKCAEKKANGNSKKPGKNLSGDANDLKKPVELSTAATSGENSKSDSNQSCRNEAEPYEVHHSLADSDSMLTPVKLAMNEVDESWMSWTDYISKQFNDITRAISYYKTNNEVPLQINAVLRWICYLFFPAVLLLGVHYVFLKKKYKNLSGKLKRIKDENSALVRESNKLESLLISTEKLTMSISTKESRAQAVADFTRLSESLMNSKKEINQMKTEKAALLEELKTARRKRDEAQNQYSTITDEVLLHDRSIKA